MSDLSLPSDAARLPASRPRKGRHAQWSPELLFFLLFAGAIAIRLIGIDWHGHHPDENPSAAARVLAGQLAVSSFYPPLFDYLIAIAYAVLYALGRMLSWWPSIDAFRAAFFDDRDTFYLTARVVTTILSALIAPLTFLLAITHGVSRRGAILAGVLAAIIPGSVFWAHVAKSDVGLAPAFLFVIIAASSVIRSPLDWRRQVLLGFAVALAMSVKHSAVFFVAPFLLITLFSSRYWRTERPSITTWATVALATILAWIPLNIGIVIDPQPFLDAQRVQTSMSVHGGAGLGSSIGATVAALTSADAGLPPFLLLAWAVAVLAVARWPASAQPQFRVVMLTLASATALAMAVLLYLGGGRQPTNLWLPYASLMAVFILIVAGAYIDRPGPRSHALGAVAVLALCFAAFSWRLVPIIVQSLAPPNGRRVAAAIRSTAPPGSAILSAVDLTPWLPQSRKSAIEQRARHERLAKKYNIQLPPPERPPPPDRAGAYTVVPFPFVFGGLENLPPDQLKTTVAYAWPLQPDEWRLDYWHDRGYHYFVADAAGRNQPVAAYRSFYRELDARCQLVADVPTSKPLFWEREILVYACARPT